ncbi:uncharacterized protein LOC115731121 isoform X1 [Rhodamnia argentea]|uniref:Uncharacterized protein LOC115731121 isoform X1 n=1 Tax=Rhodamnia argentea TaxID=178133 RepID=A0A8B8N6Q8_9MYRT|nr:uncharacterized protein LOC115731121 isoform X1 [Rhodamnia argentea]
MSGEGCCFVEWKEQFVSLERGNRVVHYFFKGSAGETILAVVGTERSVRHMFYVVADEFVQAFGSQSSIHAGFKWRSRREVVDWLTSMISKHRESPKLQKSHALRNFEFPLKRSLAQVSDCQGRLASILGGHTSEIVWSGTAWTCGKQLKHYPSFCRNGITIAIHSFVFVMGKGETRYLAYLEDMYEDRRGQKKVKIRWLHYSDEVKGVTPIRNPHPKEVFITPYAQVVSAECVDGPATVLTREHYTKCLASVPHALSSKIYLCFRQFRNNKVKSFELSKLRGYFDQPILSCFLASPLQQPDTAWNGLTGEEDEDLTSGPDVKVGGKRTRSCRGYKRCVTAYSGVKRSGGDFANLTYEPANKKLNDGLLAWRLLSLKHVNSQPRFSPRFKVGEKIELLCQDSGIRGCWFRCTILQVTRKKLKVCYDDLKDDNGSAHLEEWIPAVKYAAPDKLGMRVSSRLTIRPIPSSVDQSKPPLDVGVAVDAWWSDGWWEGVVIGVNDSEDDNLKIYFPGENLFMSMQMKDLRISRDWVGDRWIDIKAKPDILSAMTSAVALDSKHSVSSTMIKEVKSDDVTASDADTTTAIEVICDEGKLNCATTRSNGLAEDVDPADDKNLSPLIHERNEDDDYYKINDIRNHEGDIGGSDDDDDIDDDDVEDEVQSDDDNALDMDASEASAQNCKLMEIMEVVA